MKRELHCYKYDELTGLLTRYDFYKKLNKKISNNEEFYLSLIDINNLHVINKKRGYRVGDRVIRLVAYEIKSLLKEIKNINIYRIGGDEFIVISNTDISCILEKLSSASYCSSIVRQNNTFEEIFDKLDNCLIEKKKYKILKGDFKDRRKKKELLIDIIYNFFYLLFYKDRRKS